MIFLLCITSLYILFKFLVMTCSPLYSCIPGELCRCVHHQVYECEPCYNAHLCWVDASLPSEEDWTVARAREGNDWNARQNRSWINWYLANLHLLYSYSNAIVNILNLIFRQFLIFVIIVIQTFFVNAVKILWSVKNKQLKPVEY